MCVYVPALVYVRETGHVSKGEKERVCMCVRVSIVVYGVCGSVRVCVRCVWVCTCVC